MESKIILGRILQKLIDVGEAQVMGYYKFGYIRYTNNTVWVTRETGADTSIPFSKIIIGIEAYRDNPSLYDKGPNALREVGISRVNSPIFALLHLLNKEDFI